MSPLQYQRQLGLLYARRPMLTRGSNVETAAIQANYESASQFNREYARIFGRPPRRDVHALEAAPVDSAGHM
nr:AraC family transcriptional regulator [Acidisarcina polymorpha]